MDAAHPLLQTVRVPGDVVVEQNIADLEVDPFAGRFGGHKHLNRTFAELLLCEKPRSGFIPRPRPHATVDAADRKAPPFEFPHKILKRIPEFGKEEKAFVGLVEESFFVKQIPEF